VEQHDHSNFAFNGNSSAIRRFLLRPFAVSLTPKPKPDCNFHQARESSKLDAILRPSILMPMSFDASQRFKFCAVAKFKHLSVLPPPAFDFCTRNKPLLPTETNL
jgi:hypothetical protein